MFKFSVREWFAVVGDRSCSSQARSSAVCSTHSTFCPHGRDAGWGLAVASILGLLLFIGTTVRGLLRTDTEGVERQDAARASMIAVLVIVMAGFAYALLEAFAGLPRMTAAAPAAATALVRMIAFAWRLRGGEEG
ncbi:hypothetical protein [Actinomyces gerencseriae]|uniref:hypothetical protein n=2 Tax=Actinomyces gerencseriae TaxID=52769 RepID=UPI0023F28FD8|nr:hypothetical protein [Actinomyces gerencseriae]